MPRRELDLEQAWHTAEVYLRRRMTTPRDGHAAVMMILKHLAEKAGVSGPSEPKESAEIQSLKKEVAELKKKVAAIEGEITTPPASADKVQAPVKADPVKPEPVKPEPVVEPGIPAPASGLKAPDLKIGPAPARRAQDDK